MVFLPSFLPSFLLVVLSFLPSFLLVVLSFLLLSCRIASATVRRRLIPPYARWSMSAVHAHALAPWIHPLSPVLPRLWM